MEMILSTAFYSANYDEIFQNLKDDSHKLDYKMHADAVCRVKIRNFSISVAMQLSVAANACRVIQPSESQVYDWRPFIRLVSGLVWCQWPCLMLGRSWTHIPPMLWRFDGSINFQLFLWSSVWPGNSHQMSIKVAQKCFH